MVEVLPLADGLKPEEDFGSDLCDSKYERERDDDVVNVDISPGTATDTFFAFPSGTVALCVIYMYVHGPVTVHVNVTLNA